MPKYVIERNMPGVGASSAEELKAASRKSNCTLDDLGGKVHWQQSYVTGDKLYCVYIAENKQAVQEHAKRSGFPADRISEVKTILDPASGE